MNAPPVGESHPLLSPILRTKRKRISNERSDSPRITRFARRSDDDRVSRVHAQSEDTGPARGSAATIEQVRSQAEELAATLAEMVADLGSRSLKVNRRSQSRGIQALYFLDHDAVPAHLQAELAAALGKLVCSDPKILDEQGREAFAKRSVRLTTMPDVPQATAVDVLTTLIRNASLRNFSLDEAHRAELLKHSLQLMAENDVVRQTNAVLARTMAWNVLTGSLPLSIQDGRNFIERALRIFREGQLAAASRADLASSLVACTKLNVLYPTDQQRFALAEHSYSVFDDAELPMDARITLVINLIEAHMSKRITMDESQRRRVVAEGVAVLPQCEAAPHNYEALVIALLNGVAKRELPLQADKLHLFFTSLDTMLSRSKMPVAARERIAARLLTSLENNGLPVQGHTAKSRIEQLVALYPNVRLTAITLNLRRVTVNDAP